MSGLVLWVVLFWSWLLFGVCVMSWRGICNVFESFVIVRLFALITVSSDSSDTFCIVAGSEVSGTSCKVVVICCRLY